MLPIDHNYKISKLKFYEESELEEETKIITEFEVNICKEEEIESFFNI